MNLLKYGKLEQNPAKILESLNVKPIVSTKMNGSLTESEGSQPTFIMPRIEAIHAGATRNEVVYLGEKLRGNEELKSGVYSWTKPYPKPLIYNHDVYTEATGRIHTAAYSEYTQAGRPGIIVVPKVTDKKAIKDVLEGRLLTVSIGATTDSATCNICGTDIINEGWCGHMKGETYDDKKAQWVAGNLWFDELSWVNVPADQDAMVIDTETSIFLPQEQVENPSMTNEFFGIPKDKEILIVSSGLTESYKVVEKEGKTEEGAEKMTEEQIKALQEELEGVKKELEETKTSLDSEKSLTKELTEEIEGLKTLKEELETTVSSTKESLSEAQKELEEAKQNISQLEEEKAALVTSLEEEKAGREELAQENNTLSQEVKESTIARIADLRMVLGKESDRESVKAKLAERSMDSLKDSLVDLAEEADSFSKTLLTVNPSSLGETLRQPISNPVQPTKEVEKVEEKTVSGADFLIRMLKGN